MNKNNNGLIKTIVELKNENEKLEELINFLQMENFDYALKRNHVENVLRNVHSITKNTPGKLLETFDDICNILQVGQVQKEKSVLESEKSKSGRLLQTSGKNSIYNKAHIVKPHMVNGHILYVPTINLTRVSNLNTQTNNNERSTAVTATLPNNENNNTNDSANSIINEENEIEMDNTPESSGEFQAENQLAQIEEVSETSVSSPSKSPSHSTVLSGTFQEVKIYLNQISSENLQEEPKRSSKRKTQRTSAKQSKSPMKRSTVSFDHITKRKRS